MKEKVPSYPQSVMESACDSKTVAISMHGQLGVVSSMHGLLRDQGFVTYHETMRPAFQDYERK